MNGFTHVWDRLREAYQGRHEPEQMRQLRTLYWRIVLFMTAIVVSVSVVHGIWNTQRVMATIENIPTSNSIPAAALDRSALDVLVQGFFNRQDLFARLSSGASSTPIADPNQ